MYLLYIHFHFSLLLLQLKKRVKVLKPGWGCGEQQRREAAAVRSPWWSTWHTIVVVVDKHKYNTNTNTNAKTNKNRNTWELWSAWSLET